MSEQELSDMEFVREFIGFFGAPRAFGLLGWCVVWSLLGYRSLGELRKQGKEPDGWNNASRYNAVRDLERFRAYLVEKGRLPVESTVVELARTLAHVGPAS